MIRLGWWMLRVLLALAGAVIERPDGWDGPTYGTAPGPMTA